MTICKKNNYTDTKVSKRGMGGSAPGDGAEIPLQPLEKTMLEQVVPLQPREIHSGADIHPVTHGRLQAKAGRCALKETVTLWRPMLDQPAPEELQPMGETMLEQEKSLRRKKQQRGSVMD